MEALCESPLIYALTSHYNSSVLQVLSRYSGVITGSAYMTNTLALNMDEYTGNCTLIRSLHLALHKKRCKKHHFVSSSRPHPGLHRCSWWLQQRLSRFPRQQLIVEQLL